MVRVSYPHSRIIYNLPAFLIQKLKLSTQRKGRNNLEFNELKTQIDKKQQLEIDSKTRKLLQIGRLCIISCDLTEVKTCGRVKWVIDKKIYVFTNLFFNWNFQPATEMHFLFEKKKPLWLEALFKILDRCYHILWVKNNQLEKALWKDHSQSVGTIFFKASALWRFM